MIRSGTGGRRLIGATDSQTPKPYARIAVAAHHSPESFERVHLRWTVRHRGPGQQPDPTLLRRYRLGPAALVLDGGIADRQGSWAVGIASVRGRCPGHRSSNDTMAPAQLEWPRLTVVIQLPQRSGAMAHRRARRAEGSTARTVACGHRFTTTTVGQSPYHPHRPGDQR